MRPGVQIRGHLHAKLQSWYFINNLYAMDIQHTLSRVMRKPDFLISVNTKAQINCSVTVQLISAFVFAT